MSTHHTDQEIRVRKWLTEAGWERNPFAQPGSSFRPLTRAEDEDDLGRYFVATAVQSGWPDREHANTPHEEDEGNRFQDLLDECHTVLFAESGEGKTGNRLMVAQDTSLQRTLIVHYLDVGSPPRTLEEHAREIGQRIHWAANVGRDNVTEAVSQNDLQPFLWLTELIENLTADRYTAIFVLIDNVEENLGAKSDVDKIERAVENLFDPRLLQIPKLYLKFFVPMVLAGRLTSYTVFASGKIIINKLHVRWTENRLRKLLEARIEQVSRIGTTLRSISSDERGQLLDLDGEICRFLLRYHGGPRNLAKLVCKLIQAHIVTERETVTSFQLTRRDFENAKHEFELDMSKERSKMSKPSASQQPTDKPRPFSPAVVLAAFPIILFVIAVVVVIIYRETGSPILAVSALLFGFFIYLAALVLIGTQNGFKPEQTLSFLRYELASLGANLPHLIQTISDRLRRK